MSSSPAAARSITTFDFDDFPVSPGFDDEDVNTTVYGCDGKDFCTNGDIGRSSEGNLGEFAFLELWSGPEATGALVGRVATDFGTVALKAPTGSAFRSMRFGVGFGAGCESGCDEHEEGGSQGFADDIAVEPIPEPTGAVLFGGAMLVARMATRRRPVSVHSRAPATAAALRAAKAQ